MILVVLNLGITLFLFLWGPRVKIPTLPDGTSGHVWAHGVLREGIRRLPRWWVFMSGALFAAGIVYLVLYPGFGGFKGVLGWTAVGELARDSAANRARLDPLLQRARASSIEQLAADPAALRNGERLFVDNCSACHGRGAQGNRALGAPDLTDADWLYGGDGETIVTSIRDGRRGGMPSFATTIPDASIVDLAHYVKSLSGLPHDPLKAALGKPLFTTCAACHGAKGTGNPALGAPNLADATWLYGSNLADIEKTVREGRSGVMPAWRDRLAADEIRMVAAWLYAQSHPAP
jgi:cytochrome c oxidase cbb3-type subunit 3